MPKEQTTVRPKLSAYVSVVAALLVLAGFAYLAMDMIDIAKATKDPSLQWARLSQIYNSIEAIAFAAAGLLFGTIIQSKRAQDAENRADNAQTNAADARAKGSALSSRITRFKAASTRRSLESAPIEEQQMISELDEIKDLAREYFPPN